MILADRIWIPKSIEAILWDMDGVLLDTLGLDLIVCNQLVNKYIQKDISLSKEYIRSIFAYHPPEFWRLILESITDEYNISVSDSVYDEILRQYNQIRNNSVFKVNPGIPQILTDCMNKKIKLAVVSNNPTEDVKKILSKSGIIDYFNTIIGNDISTLKKKPAPDTYLYAAKLLNVVPKNCVVIEDSLLGVESGYNAKCFTIGVATGGNSYETLAQSPFANQVYSSFEPNHLFMQFGSVTNKRIYTPNDFVSHMIEHIAWRIGCEIALYWNNNDWFRLGKTFGKDIAKFENKAKSSAALGMIDDGSAEVFIELSETPKFEIKSTELIDLNWFLSLRCEQLNSGKPLISLIEGLTNGLKSNIYTRVCSVEDPHHTWEGIFRSIGIALGQMFTPILSVSNFDNGEQKLTAKKDGLCVEKRSVNFAKVTRKTAETNVSVYADFRKQNHNRFAFNVSSSININGLSDMLEILSTKAGFSIEIDFDAAKLNSSHVVLEDTALVLGKTLKEILILRMQRYGVNGAGSSISTLEDMHTQPIRVGVSVEGRKFMNIVPFNEPIDELKKRFIIGQTVFNDLFSEDLDDFLDGLAGGLDCSIVVHIKKCVDPDEGWKMILANLGKAINEVFRANPYRKGVPPGVKATMY